MHDPGSPLVNAQDPAQQGSTVLGFAKLNTELLPAWLREAVKCSKSRRDQMLSIQAMERSRKPVAKTAACRIDAMNMARSLSSLRNSESVPGKWYSVLLPQNGS
jgi:hypothetical protein